MNSFHLGIIFICNVKENRLVNGNHHYVSHMLKMPDSCNLSFSEMYTVKLRFKTTPKLRPLHY